MATRPYGTSSGRGREVLRDEVRLVDDRLGDAELREIGRLAEMSDHLLGSDVPRSGAYQPLLSTIATRAMRPHPTEKIRRVSAHARLDRYSTSGVTFSTVMDGASGCSARTVSRSCSGEYGGGSDAPIPVSAMGMIALAVIPCAAPSSATTLHRPTTPAFAAP